MITIDESRPYRHPTEEEWEALPIVEIPIADLVLSQMHASAVAYLANLAYTSPPPVRCVVHGTRTHVHDGHHRVLIAAARGRSSVPGKLAS